MLRTVARALGLTAAQTRAPKLSSSERGAVVPDLALWNASSRIGGGVTPARITSIIRMADNGDMRQLMDLANECRQRDAHLQAVLGTNEETIAALPWQLVPSSQNERARDRRAREWCETALRANPHLPRLIGHLAGAVYYSYAVSETLWGKSSGRLVPTEFRPLAPRRFGFRPYDGLFVWRDAGMGQDGIDFRAQHPHKFIISQPRVTGDIPNREGLCRSLVWMSVFRNWVISDWLKTAEISWKPWRIGTYQKNGSTTEDRDDLESVMRQLTTDGAAVIANTSDIKIQWPGGTTGTARTHGDFVNALGQEMSKAVLGQTETTQSSASSGYAQARVHNEVRHDLREARARQIAADITRDLVASMILLNFGSSVAVPRFEFITQDPTDLRSFGEALNSMVQAGVPVPVAWALEQAGIPSRKGDEPVLGQSSEAGESEPSTEPEDDGSVDVEIEDEPEPEAP